MKILVTGANGYLGTGIVKAILDSGNEVVAVDFGTEHVDDRAIKMDCNLFEDYLKNKIAEENIEINKIIEKEILIAYEELKNAIFK